MLDSVDGSRESFVIVRRGREVATVAPVAPATGRRLKAVLEAHQVDSAWAGELETLRGALRDEPPTWRD